MYLPVFLCLYESFQNGFESDQGRLTFLVIKMRLPVWRVVNKTLKISSHVSSVVMLTINSRSPWEMISGFNLKATTREKTTSFSGSLSYPQGRVGENPGNGVAEKRLFSLLVAVRGQLIINHIRNDVRQNRSILFTTRRTSKRILITSNVNRP